VSALANLIFELEQYKKIVIFGYGVEGKSFDAFAKRYLRESEITIVDKGDSKDESYLKGLDDAELIIKSPGISLYNLGIDNNAYNFTSITELFLRYFGQQTIGVTGTKGKSTLVTLIHSLLKNAQRKTLLCGNIGVPAFDILEEITPETTVVMELSSHQLMDCNYSPHFAILTNLFEEHLDYYRDVAEYYQAKYNIFLHQKEGDVFIYNLPNNLEHEGINVHAKALKIKPDFDIKRGFIHEASLQILEEVAEILDIDEGAYEKTLGEFKTLPHRLEFVAEIDGVVYINDSIATIPEATIEAIKILKSVDTLIVGGNDRGISYDAFVEYLTQSGVKNIICFSDTGKQIHDKFKNSNSSQKIFYFQELREGVEKAHAVAQKIVLFSPAASSFNVYKNFMERGESFKRFVKSLQQS